MKLSPLQSQKIQRNAQGAYASMASVHMPSQAAPANYDPFTGDIVDITQSITTTWSVSYIPCRIAHPSDISSTVYIYKPVVEVRDPNDVILSTDLSYESLLSGARDTERAYVMADGETLRVVSVERNRVEGHSSLTVLCKPTTVSK